MYRMFWYWSSSLWSPRPASLPLLASERTANALTSRLTLFNFNVCREKLITSTPHILRRCNVYGFKFCQRDTNNGLQGVNEFSFVPITDRFQCSCLFHYSLQLNKISTTQRLKHTNTWTGCTQTGLSRIFLARPSKSDHLEHRRRVALRWSLGRHAVCMEPTQNIISWQCYWCTKAEREEVEEASGKEKIRNA
jgi:hypothetical protein